MTPDLLTDLLEKLKDGTDVRQTLISIRNLLTQEECTDMKAVLRQETELLTAFLKHEDPKVRKNAALILGELETEACLPFLFDAYEKEETLFVRADYLKAAAKMDCRSWLPVLEERERQLAGAETSGPDRKHTAQELRALRDLIWKINSPSNHHFRLPGRKVDVILLTSRALRDLTIRQVKASSVRGLGAGARFHGADLKQVLDIRTYTELLFPVPGLPTVPPDPYDAGEMLAGAGIPAFLDTMHEEGGIYRYRVEIRGEEKTGTKIRRLCAALEQKEGRLANSVSDYEVEIRLLKKKEGDYIPCLKLYTIPDERFQYRKGFTADSISPVNAALTVCFAASYLKEGARVLDPFCGVGTMLIERDKAVPARELYGTDIFGEAVAMGRENAALAGLDIRFVNRDILTFTHDRPFDEIITDMPAAQTDPVTGSRQEPRELYHAFFEKIPQLLTDGAVLVLYTPKPALVSECIAKDSRFKTAAQVQLDDRRGTGIMVITFRSSAE